MPMAIARQHSFNIPQYDNGLKSLKNWVGHWVSVEEAKTASDEQSIYSWCKKRIMHVTFYDFFKSRENILNKIFTCMHVIE
jgi:hypothetical protein